MKRIITTLLFLTIAYPAYALTVSTTPMQYTDLDRFTLKEEVAINILTELGAVSGNPDGTFAPARTLNRAEFVKIVLNSYPELNKNQLIPESCFADVNRQAWYSQYVCYAKAQQIVAGYPDGLFRPEQTVNYAEALKILGELYLHPITNEPNETWYAPYMRAATTKQIDFRIAADAPLTRGQMAQMAAVYYAEHIDELAEYRLLETGAQSSSSSVSSSSSSSVASSESSAESSSSVSSSDPLAVESGFLYPGEVGTPLIMGTFTAPEAGSIKLASLRLNRKIRSFSQLQLINAQQEVLATFIKKFDDSTDKEWRAELDDSAIALIAGEKITLYVRPVVNSVAQGVFAGEFIQAEYFSLQLQTAASNASRELIGSNPPYPAKQIVVAHITSITNSGAMVGTLHPKRVATIGNFTIEADTVAAPVILNSITFGVQASSNVRIKAPVLRDAKGNTSDCQLASSKIICNITDYQLATINGSTNLRITADIELATDEPGTMQLTLPHAGTQGVIIGSITWTDGGGNYNWLPLASPLVELTNWTVTP